MTAKLVGVRTFCRKLVPWAAQRQARRRRAGQDLWREVGARLLPRTCRHRRLHASVAAVAQRLLTRRARLVELARAHAHDARVAWPQAQLGRVALGERQRVARGAQAQDAAFPVRARHLAHRARRQHHERARDGRDSARCAVPDAKHDCSVAGDGRVEGAAREACPRKVVAGLARGHQYGQVAFDVVLGCSALRRAAQRSAV